MDLEVLTLSRPVFRYSTRLATALAGQRLGASVTVT